MAALREAGLTARIGVAPGPANGFTLDLIACLERFGDRIDWAMVILNPLEPWPGELCLDAAARHEVKVLTRVVDYGGLFWGDLRPGMELAERDHRAFRPAGWIEAGLEKLERLLPIAERAELTPIQLACQWNLAHPAVECVRPDPDPGGWARRRCPIEAKRVELAALPAEQRLSRRGRRRDPRDRRQHRLHGAEGRQPRARGRGAPRPLAAQRRARRGRRPLGHRPRSRPGRSRDAWPRVDGRASGGPWPGPAPGSSC